LKVSTQSRRPGPSETPAGGRPVLTGLALLVVLGPLAGLLALAHFSGQDAVALLGVPTSLLLAWAMLRLRGERWADVGLRRAHRWGALLRVVGVAVLLLLVATTLLGYLLAAAGWLPDISRFDPLRGDPAVLLAGLLLVWTTAAFGEEMLFRGFVMHSIHRLCRDAGWGRRPWAWALTLTAVLFGCGHAYEGPAGCVLAGAIGLGYGLTYFASRRSLWGPILAHGAYDTVAFVLVFLSWDYLLLPSG
jgi:membrane protease YdiL (CAAX protease family)